MKFSNGTIVNCFYTGNINYQGKNIPETKSLIEGGVQNDREYNRKVFVVYGQDRAAKAELGEMLRKWELEPLILDQLPSEGKTVIEKLENYIEQVNFGIVLATPDDMVCAKGHENNLKCRVRQNVILEMGMLLSRLGRTHVAILLNENEDLEKPSDINGLMYISFKDSVHETKVNLAQEMQKCGCRLDIAKYC